MQEPVGFKVSGQSLCGMLHLPDGVEAPVPAVVLCHGFTGHKIEAHCLFVKMARALSVVGIGALRFDFRGSGESDGEFREMTVSREIEDASAAVDFLVADGRVDSERLGVLGLSLGGCVAACLAGADTRVRSVALWSAVARPEAVCSEPPRAHWADRVRRHGHMDIGGNVLGAGFVEDLPRHDPPSALSRSRAPVLIVHGQADTSVPVSDAGLYAEALAGRPAAVEKLIVADADHTFSTVKWEQVVMGRTVEWFERTLASCPRRSGSASSRSE